MTTSASTASPQISPEQSPVLMASLFRATAVAMVAGCSILAAGDLVRAVSGTDDANPFLALGWFIQAVGASLALLALPGFCTRVAGRAGVLGVAGIAGITLFLLYFGIFAGLLHALAVPGLTAQGATRPDAVKIGFLVSAIFGSLGSVALGAGLWRARHLSPAVPLLLIAGGVVLLAGHPIPHVEDAGLLMLLAGLGWAGSRLRAEMGSEPERSGAGEEDPGEAV